MSVKKAFLLWAMAVSALIALNPVGQSMAYLFSSTWVTIEASDVTAVSGDAMNAVGTLYEILKFLGLFLMISAAGWVLSKILWIKIWWSWGGQ